MKVKEINPEDLEAAREGIQHLVSHLTSLKFEADPYVNVNDVLPVLLRIRRHLSSRFTNED